MRTPEKFSSAYKEAVEQAIRHKKDFWIVPTGGAEGYVVSCFEPTVGVPEGTKPLRVTPSEATEQNARWQNTPAA